MAQQLLFLGGMVGVVHNCKLSELVSDQGRGANHWCRAEVWKAVVQVPPSAWDSAMRDGGGIRSGAVQRATAARNMDETKAATYEYDNGADFRAKSFMLK
jgi:hypothetical protein